jgi:hypothetical protein
MRSSMGVFDAEAEADILAVVVVKRRRWIKPGRVVRRGIYLCWV